MPDEPVELPPDRPLLAHVEEQVDASCVEVDSALEWIERSSVYDESIPTDLADQHDHYLYGGRRRPAGNSPDPRTVT
ncbi:MAG: hypothetical protein HUU22_15550 [Phycisphaerae bacterium]|nr:hypothetical protein [Phycisphaerae bacterium]NUQ47440.1 hypothetical protein [Phycisphaerae bacterium]